MPHNFNINNFRLNQTDKSKPLLYLYSSLVALELILKDHIFLTNSNWTTDHYIDQMLAQIPIPSTDLINEFRKMNYTDRDGINSKPLDLLLPIHRPISYPYIRYLRHESDFTDGSGTTTSQIDICINLVEDIFKILKQKGIYQ